MEQLFKTFLREQKKISVVPTNFVATVVSSMLVGTFILVLFKVSSKHAKTSMLK